MYEQMKLITSADSDFEQQLEQKIAWEEALDDAVENQVKEILLNIKRKGDKALLDYTARFDHYSVKSVSELELTPIQTKRALD